MTYEELQTFREKSLRLSQMSLDSRADLARAEDALMISKITHANLCNEARRAALEYEAAFAKYQRERTHP